MADNLRHHIEKRKPRQRLADLDFAYGTLLGKADQYVSARQQIVEELVWSMKGRLVKEHLGRMIGHRLDRHTGEHLTAKLAEDRVARWDAKANPAAGLLTFSIPLFQLFFS